MTKIEMATAPCSAGSDYPEPYDVPCRDRVRRALGDAAGLTQFGVNLLQLPPGAWSGQRHWHTAEDEFVWILEGEVVLVTEGREEILRVHSKKVKLAEGVDMNVVARGTPGYSGAELANVINEAALLAARRGLKGITLRELEEARDKVRWGKERRSMALSEKEKQNTAYHEAGHALLLELLPHTEPLHKVTIIPRGPSLGSTMWLPEEDKYTNRKNELLASLVVKMGGRVAEEIVFGDVTNGASGDIKMATNVARRMVCEWGMSEKMGMVEYGEHEEHVFLGRDMGRARGYSEATAEEIDREVRKLIDDAYDHAKRTLIEHRDKLEAIAKGLLEFETLDGHHIRDILEHGRMLNPPPGPPAPKGPEMQPEKPPKQVVVAPDVNPPLPGGLSGAPA